VRCAAWDSKAPSWPAPKVAAFNLKLLKIGVQLRISVRRVWLSFSESYPYAELFRQVLNNLRAPPPVAGTA
jgi:hypothetical protein